MALATQISPSCSPETKIRLALLSKALVDALGGPAEFKPRFSFNEVRTMIPNQNFRLPAGVWTDDTSMALCLARSLAEKGGFDLAHQLELYLRWRGKGYLSAVGYCFDVGTTIGRALRIYAVADCNAEVALKEIAKVSDSEDFCGNGSLMRVLPVGLAYWRDEQQAREYGSQSSLATHPFVMCREICAAWCGAISTIMQNPGMSKLEVLEYFTQFPFTDEKLKEHLNLPADVADGPTEDASQEEREKFYWEHHSLLQKITTSRKSKSLPSVELLPSGGYVLESAVAALFAFFATSTFEEGAIFTVNLGGDADTVGAIYGGLAGCWYAVEETDEDGLFWTPLVREWRNDLYERKMVEDVAEELVQFSATLVPAA